MASLASVAFTINFEADDQPTDFLRSLADLFANSRIVTGRKNVPTPKLTAPANEEVQHHATAPMIKAPAKPAPESPAVDPAEIVHATPAFDAEKNQRLLDEAKEKEATKEPKRRGRAAKGGTGAEAVDAGAKVANPAGPAAPVKDDPVDFGFGGPEAPDDPLAIDLGGAEPAGEETFDGITVGALRELGNSLIQLTEKGVGGSLVMTTLGRFKVARYPDLKPEQRAEAAREWIKLIPEDQLSAVRERMAKAPA